MALMFTMFSVLAEVATAASEPAGRPVTEVPELASMALLSVLLAGISVAVRRTGPKAGADASLSPRRIADKP